MSSTPSKVEPPDWMRPNADPPDRPQRGLIALRNSRFSIGILPRLEGAVTHFVEHPWFPAGPAMLQAGARTLWRIDDRKLFIEKLPVPARWDFSQGRPLTGADLEHGFSGWDGTAAVWWTGRPGRLLIRASESLRHLVIYTRDPRGDFCVEPVSHAVDGFNLFAAGVTDTGTVVLAPGQTLEGTATFTVAD